jgi:hypothetical protein
LGAEAKSGKTLRSSVVGASATGPNMAQRT